MTTRSSIATASVALLCHAALALQPASAATSKTSVAHRSSAFTNPGVRKALTHQPAVSHRIGASTSPGTRDVASPRRSRAVVGGVSSPIPSGPAAPSRPMPRDVGQVGGQVPHTPLITPGPIGPYSHLSPRSSLVPPSCDVLRQNVSALQSKMKLLQGFMNSFDQSIASYEQQMQDIIDQIESLQRALGKVGSQLLTLQQRQQSLQKEADVARDLGQGTTASMLEAAATALGATIRDLQQDQAGLLAQVNNLLQQVGTLAQLVKHFIDGKEQAQAVLDQLNQQFLLSFTSYEGWCSRGIDPR